jgi:hypothetical protein
MLVWVQTPSLQVTLEHTSAPGGVAAPKILPRDSCIVVALLILNKCVSSDAL